MKRLRKDARQGGFAPMGCGRPLEKSAGYVRRLGNLFHEASGVHSYQMRLMRTTTVLVVLAVLVSGLCTSFFLTRYMDQQIGNLRTQICDQDVESIRMQLAGINGAILNLASSSDVALLQAGRSGEQARIQAILGISERIESVMSSAEGLKSLFLYVPRLDIIVSIGSEGADTYLRYRITGDWDQARTLKQQILSVKRLTYVPNPQGVMGVGYMLEIMPLPLGESQPKAYVCAVIQPRVEQFGEKLTDAKMLCNGTELLGFAGLDQDDLPTDAEIQALLENESTHVALNGRQYQISKKKLPFGNLQYVYLTSNALQNRHVYKAWITSAMLTLCFSLAVTVIALRCSRKLYQPVGTLINALVAQGRIAAGKSPDELTAIGRLVDEVLMDNAKLNRTVDALTPMLDDLAFYHVLHNSEGPECVEWLNAFSEKYLQLVVVRFSHSHVMRQQHMPESLNRMLRLVAHSIHGLMSDAFCVRTAVMDGEIFVVFSHDMSPEAFRLKAAARMDQVQEQTIANFGATVLYAASMPRPRCMSARENAALLREMADQCAQGFEGCFLRSQSSGGVWDVLRQETVDGKVPALTPVRLETRMIALLHVGKVHEAWNEMQGFLHERLCEDGISCSVMRKLLVGGLDVLYKAMTSSGRDAEFILGDYRDMCARLENCDTFEDAMTYLHGMFEQAGSAIQMETSGLPVGQKELDEYIHANWNRDISLCSAAEHWRLSEGYFSKIVKNLTGESFPDYLSHCRVERARELMGNSAFTIAEISERAGFNNYRTFTRCFRKFYDMSPSEYRRNMEETR